MAGKQTEDLETDFDLEPVTEPDTTDPVVEVVKPEVKPEVVKPKPTKGESGQWLAFDWKATAANRPAPAAAGKPADDGKWQKFVWVSK